MVGLLELAAMDGIEAVLAVRLEAMLGDGDLPDLEALREEFSPRQADHPVIHVQMPATSCYDALLGQGVAA
ncbi:hypothetical protein CT19431_P30039 [Cupriavidus taiwanensis]|nr:hypothetical protein CT19431_P30039 [Cupriavidus taiwanensis]